MERAGREPAETIAVFRVPGSWEQEARGIMAAAGVEALGAGDFPGPGCAHGGGKGQRPCCLIPVPESWCRNHRARSPGDGGGHAGLRQQHRRRGDPWQGRGEVQGIPVYDTLGQVLEEHDPAISVISVPAPAVLEAALEAFAHGIELCVIMSEWVPRLTPAGSWPPPMPDARSSAPTLWGSFAPAWPRWAPSAAAWTMCAAPTWKGRWRCCRGAAG